MTFHIRIILAVSVSSDSSPESSEPTEAMALDALGSETEAAAVYKELEETHPLILRSAE